MKPRRLADFEISVHNRPGSRSITLSQYISERLFNEGMQYVKAEYFTLTFCKEGKEGFAKLSYNLQGNKPSASFSKKAFVDSICSFFCVGVGNYYFETSELKPRDEVMEIYCVNIYERQPIGGSDKHKTKTCPKCQRTLPMSEFYVMTSRPDGHSTFCKECNGIQLQCRDEQKAEPAISQATDRQLYDELKRRGYDGKLTKTSTLE